MHALLTIDNLVKDYGDRKAVDGLSLTVERGEIYGLLGPNGAGKTTTIRIVTGILRPTAGRVRVAGFDPFADPSEAKSRLGWVGQELSLYDDLTAEENLRFACALARVPRREVAKRVAELLESAGLADRARERLGKYSGGMKRRLHLVLALVHRPELLLLDEPLVGIDPQARAHLIGAIEALAANGHGVLLTTHDMDDAQRLCARVGIVDRGRLVAEGTIDELRARLGSSDLLRLSGAFDPSSPPPLPAALDLELLACRDDELLVAAESGAEALPAVLAAVEATGVRVERAALERPTLETLFLELTGRELRD